MGKPRKANLELAELVASTYADPLLFVKIAFPWGEGPLAGQKGPDKWQEQFLRDLGEQVKQRKFDGVHAVPPIRMAVSSGHGCGKSTISAWIACWILSTRPYSIGTVTANTGVQLQSKTFAAIRTWLSRCITAPWWEIGAEKIRHLEHPSSWFLNAQTSNEDKSEAFAGQHAANSTSWYLFDEASAIPDKIWEVAAGGTSDGEAMWFAFGNCTRNSGMFHDVCFGDSKGRWDVRCVDSRDSALTNKALIDEWISDHGISSDFVRVRVLGLPPKASDQQFIPSDVVKDASNRQPIYLSDDVLVAGADISRGGEDNTVIRFRRGMDATSIPPIKLSAEMTRDSTRTVAVLSELFNKDFGDGLKLGHLFVDETGVGGPLVDRLKQLGHGRITGINFGRTAPEEGYLNMRSFMWGKMKEWLKNGSIEKDQDLLADLIGPGYSYNAQSKLVLESKESMKRRGIGSPDDGDALALTFAANVSPRKSATSYSRRDSMIRSLRNNSTSAWMS